MLRASKACARWGFAATLLLAFVGAAATPAAAQTPPPPDPLASLLPNLLAPLAPILSPPSQKPAAPNPSGNHAGTGPPASVNTVPPNPEVRCGGTPVPLSFARTPGRTTQPLVDAASKLTGPGQNVNQVLVRIAAPFPVAGEASYRDDWGEPRTTPCPHLHQGNDIFAAFGVPFVAPGGGVVTRYGFESVGGNSVYFSGDDGYSFYGAHLETFGPNLRIGEHVDAGTILGYVGNTGDAMGGSPHLHFQLYPPHGSGPVDPKFWLDASLNTAITKAGGIVPVEGGPGGGGPVAVNIGGLMNSVLLAGGHIIDQPTVPVLLFVAILLGTLGISQRRTLKVAVELRRSRSSAQIPSFVTGSVVAAREALTVKQSRRKKRAEGGPAGTPAPDQPLWAQPPAGARPVEHKPSPVARIAGSVGESWAKFPARMSGVSAASSKSNGTGHAAQFNGNGNGQGHSNGNGNGNGKRKAACTSTWSPGASGGSGSRFVKR